MAQRTSLKVGGVPEHFNLPWHQAINEGAFEKQHLEIEFVDFPGGTGAMTSALKSGEIDIALLLFEGAVTNILRGNLNRIVKVYVDSPLIWGIHVAGHSKIQTVDQIEGKVFAISRAGSGSHLIAIVDSAERGWPTNQMKFSKVGNLAGAREKLANGKVDVFLWEKYTTQPLVDTGEFRRVGERIVPWPAFVVSVRQTVLEQCETQLRNMLEIVDLYSQRFKSNPKSVDLVSETFNIKTADSQIWFDHVQWKSGFDCPEETIATIVRYLNEVNVIENNNATYADVWHQL